MSRPSDRPAPAPLFAVLGVVLQLAAVGLAFFLPLYFRDLEGLVWSFGLGAGLLLVGVVVGSLLAARARRGQARGLGLGLLLGVGFLILGIGLCFAATAVR